MTTDPISHDCRPDYFPASRSSGTRPLHHVMWIVLHDEEAPDARSAASWFHDQRAPDRGGPAGSAHLCVDDTVCYRTLANETIPWGAASSFGANGYGFHIEQAGYAAWKVWRWKQHLGTIKRAAYKTAVHCHKFNIPPVFVDAGQLPNNRGITTHAEVTKASKRMDPAHAWKYDHTDPGPFWPRGLFMRYVNSYYKALA